MYVDRLEHISILDEPLPQSVLRTEEKQRQPPKEQRGKAEHAGTELRHHTRRK